MKAITWSMLALILALGACQKVGEKMACGEETFKVDFGDQAATVTGSDKANSTLPLLESSKAAGAAKVYSNGALTFTRLTPSGAPPVIKFARGRMAFQDCRMAAN